MEQHIINTIAAFLNTYPELENKNLSVIELPDNRARVQIDDEAFIVIVEPEQTVEKVLNKRLDEIENIVDSLGDDEVDALEGFFEDMESFAYARMNP